MFKQTANIFWHWPLRRSSSQKKGWTRPSLRCTPAGPCHAGQVWCIRGATRSVPSSCLTHRSCAAALSWRDNEEHGGWTRRSGLGWTRPSHSLSAGPGQARDSRPKIAASARMSKCLSCLRPESPPPSWKIQRVLGSPMAPWPALWPCWQASAPAVASSSIADRLGVCRLAGTLEAELFAKVRATGAPSFLKYFIQHVRQKGRLPSTQKNSVPPHSVSEHVTDPPSCLCLLKKS